MGNLSSKRKINETSDEVLKGAYTARVRKDREGEEPVWMNEDNPKTILVYRCALKLPLQFACKINTTDPEFNLLSRAQFIKNPPPPGYIRA